MNYISEFKKLDNILKYFQSHFHEEPMSAADIKSAIDNSFDFDKNELLPILNKLVKDAYLNSFDIEAFKRYSLNNSWAYNEKYYSITFEGKIFIQSGGYEAQETMRNSEKRRMDSLEAHQREQADTLTLLTRWVAVGTIAAALISFLLLLWETREIWHYIFS